VTIQGPMPTSPTPSLRCPCCAGAAVTRRTAPAAHFGCGGCSHRWKPEAPAAHYYRGQAGRSAFLRREAARKHRERLAFLRPDLARARRVLEIGCAEGQFGAYVKRALGRPVHWVGVEPSRDAEKARARLDEVFHGAFDACGSTAPFDLVVAFHVLEHIEDVAKTVDRARGLLREGGAFVVEVPNGAGNELLAWDHHAEHVHLFSPASLCALLAGHGFEVTGLRTQAFESAVYNDSIRVRCRPEVPAHLRAERYRARIAARLPGPFVVYGIGGDYRNLVHPYVTPDQVAALVDADPDKQGTRVQARRVLPPEALARFRDLPVLIASHRLGVTIAAAMTERFGVAPERLHRVADLLAPEPAVEDDHA
jgi:SAM-dependent methyltransferase